jgi:DSF synthase
MNSECGIPTEAPMVEVFDRQNGRQRGPIRTPHGRLQRDPRRTLSRPVGEAANPRDLGRFEELDVSIDPAQRALWCFMRPKGPPSFTFGMLREIRSVHALIDRLNTERGQNDAAPVRFYVGGSALPGIFNLGGDLTYFIAKIRSQDRDGLRAYAYRCVETIYHNGYGFDTPVVSIGVLEGDALGGGFEGAMSFNVLVAEKGVKLGTPEVLFNLFPGMGAYSFLCRKLDAVRAEKIILSGRTYLAEEFHEMGIVDVLAEKGQGRQAARDFMDDNNRRQPLLFAINRVRSRVAPITLEELREVTDIWVEMAMSLDASDLRKMEIVAQAQMRRLTRMRAG